MSNIKAMSASLALLLGVAIFAPGQATAAPLSGDLAVYRDMATPQVQLVDHGSWKHGRRHRDRHHRFFRDGLWFTFPFWLGATTAPLIIDDDYDDFDDDYGRAHLDYCFNRYRSYDPGTNSFMSYSGVRKPCISPYM